MKLTGGGILMLDCSKWRERLHGLYLKETTKEYKFIGDNELRESMSGFREDVKNNGLNLYRYSCADYWNIRNLETGTLHLSPVGWMNDAFEGISNSDYNALNIKEKGYLSEIVYIKSFSESFNDQLMWAHYAYKSSGICVEYDLSLLPDSSPIWDWIFPVVYDDNNYLDAKYKYIVEALKRLREAELTDDSFDDEFWLQDTISHFLRKGEAWNYEREWRVLIPRLNMSSRGTEQPIFENGIVPFDCISGILCGTRTDKDIEKHIHEIAERIEDRANRHVSVDRLKMCFDKNKLILRKP